MRVVAVVTDLILASRIEAIAARAGVPIVRVDDPWQLPAPDEQLVVVVDWGARQEGWGDALRAWRASSTPEHLLLVGPHADLDAHADAKRYGIGPMRARSTLPYRLTSLFTANAPNGAGTGGTRAALD